jgi:Domain of unknown function (DUF4124)
MTFSMPRSAPWCALPLALACVLIPADAFAGAIYKCKTSEGVVFSQSPCAKDAVRIDRQASAAPVANADNPLPESTDLIAIGGSSGLGTTEEIIARLGQPAAQYTLDGEDYWYYPNAVRDLEGEHVFAEMRIRSGRLRQITWLPEDVMRQSVASARRFAGWQQPAHIAAKSFTVADTDVVGNSKNDITAKFGQPDAKKLFNGREVWEYRQVHITPESPQTMTIYLEFDADTVVASTGN